VGADSSDAGWSNPSEGES